jgi:hypothetical protein
MTGTLVESTILAQRFTQPLGQRHRTALKDARKALAQRRLHLRKAG